MIVTSPFPNIEIPMVSSFNHVFKDGKMGRFANKLACIDGVSGDTLTYQQLYDTIVSLSACMSGYLGLHKGDVVAIYSLNHLQYSTVMYAANRAGLAVTAANPYYLPSEFAYQMTDSSTKVRLLLIFQVVFTHKEVLKEALEAAKLANIHPSKIFVFGNEQIGSHVSVSALIEKGRSYVNNFPAHKFTDHELLNDPAYLCYSSGIIMFDFRNNRSIKRGNLNQLQHGCQYSSI